MDLEGALNKLLSPHPEPGQRDVSSHASHSDGVCEVAQGPPGPAAICSIWFGTS